MTGLANPMPGHPIAQTFTSTLVGTPGYRSPDGFRWRSSSFSGGIYLPKMHAALDVACPVGTPVLAPERMTIRLIGWDDARGLWCQAEINPTTMLLFQHLDDVYVEPNGIIPRGSTGWARSGDSGDVTGPHLHWAVDHVATTGYYLNATLTWMRFDPQQLLVGGKNAKLTWLLPI
jgi:murein DD-endopeptidase MepM/ murein hydrolase activator NlpD